MAVNETDLVKVFIHYRIGNASDEGRAMRTLQIDGKSYQVEVPNHMPLLWFCAMSSG